MVCKTALVVGIDRYEHGWSDLENAGNDALAVDKMLRREGFAQCF